MSGSSLAGGQGQLRGAVDMLDIAWQRTAAGWDDAVRSGFEEERLEPLFKVATAAFDAIQQMADVLNAAKRHCADADRPG